MHRDGRLRERGRPDDPRQLEVRGRRRRERHGGVDGVRDREQDGQKEEPNPCRAVLMWIKTPERWHLPRPERTPVFDIRGLPRAVGTETWAAQASQEAERWLAKVPR